MKQRIVIASVCPNHDQHELAGRAGCLACDNIQLRGQITRLESAVLVNKQIAQAWAALFFLLLGVGLLFFISR